MFSKSRGGIGAELGKLNWTAIVLGIVSLTLNNKYEQLLVEQQQAQQQESIIQQQSEIIQSQTDAITQLQALLANGMLNGDGQTTANDLLTKLENQEIVLPNAATLISELKTLLNNQPQGATVTFKPYTVVAGDTLTKICAANGLDYGAYHKVILALNGIQDVNQIYVDQTILLPVTAE